MQYRDIHLNVFAVTKVGVLSLTGDKVGSP